MDFVSRYVKVKSRKRADGTLPRQSAGHLRNRAWVIVRGKGFRRLRKISACDC